MGKRKHNSVLSIIYQLIKEAPGIGDPDSLFNIILKERICFKGSRGSIISS